MRKQIIIACTAVVLGLAGAAFAQPAAAEQPAAEAPSTAPADPAAMQPPAGAPARPAADPLAMRKTCQEVLRTDAEWRAQLKKELAWSIVEDEPDPADAEWRARLKQKLAAEVHEEDAGRMLTNKKHVVMAYAALWILTLVFVVFMWTRQSGLKAEIARLQRDIQSAAKEDGAS